MSSAPSQASMRASGDTMEDGMGSPSPPPLLASDSDSPPLVQSPPPSGSPQTHPRAANPGSPVRRKPASRARNPPRSSSLTSDFPPHAPSSPTHAHILGMDRSTPVHMSDLGPDSSELIQKLVRENEKLRQRLAWHEDRRASHLLVEEDDDDWSVSSAGRVTRTDQISHSKLAAVPLRAVDVLRPADGAFIPEGLRSPMSRPSRFLGAGNMPSPNKLRTVVHAMPDLSLASAPLAASGMSSPRSGSTEGSPGSLRAKSFEAFSDRLKHLRELRRSSQDESEPDAKDADNQVLLKRGGVVVRTSIGYIQFGIPPETIKDSLLVGIDVPRIFVVPPERFDCERGLNMCEVEFPGYYQFFLRKRDVVLVASEEAERSLRALLTETLLGPPPEHLYARDECVDQASCPDHEKEIAYFVRPRDGKSVDVDSIYKFVQFKDAVEDLMCKLDVGGASEARRPSTTTVATLGAGVEIHDVGQSWLVYDRGQVVATVNKALMKTKSMMKMVTQFPSKVFIPPVFGVTVLGSSHGFDPHQSTSGFVLWIHGKGVMVDPPPDASDLLRREGISPRAVTAIVLTHCHADHDAGTFQKVLVEGRVQLFTTKTILASFMRKYARISTFTEMFLSRLMEPRMVRPGEPVPYNGGILTFFYSLHALPCIGFKAEVGGKSFVYSADTFYDPVQLPVLMQEKVLNPGRCQALLNFPFDSVDVVLHEAGIPPIHTSIKILQALPMSARKRLRIIHTDDATARNSGLALAKAGTENTIVIIPCADTSGDVDQYSIDVLTKSELFFPSRVRHTMRFSNLAPSSLSHHASKNDFDWLDVMATQQAPPAQPGSILGMSSFTSGITRSSKLTSASPMQSPTGAATRPYYTGTAGGTVMSSNTQPRRSSLLEVESGELSLSQISTILRLATRMQRRRGEVVSAPVGQRDEFLYLLASGFCELTDELGREPLAADQEPPEGPDGTFLESGDSFGLFDAKSGGLKRRCAVVALTDVVMLAFDKQALLYMYLVHPHLEGRMRLIREARASEAWRTLDLNSVLSRLLASQRSQLQTVAVEISVDAGTRLWECGKPVACMYIVAKGELVFLDEDDAELMPGVISSGALFCNVPSMIRQRSGLVQGVDAQDVNSTVTLMAKTTASVFRIRNLDALAFLERNPGIMVQAFPNLVVE